MTEPSETNVFSEPARIILHPTDFSSESQLALAHALRLAISNSAEIIILHVGTKSESEHFPSVRKMLERWGLLEPGTARSAVDSLGISVEKIEAFGPSVAGAIAHYLDRKPIDLLVMATHGRRGLAAWLHPSKAEETARQIDIPTLFVPANCRGCVSVDDGSVSMRKIIVPVDHEPRSDEAVERGLRALRGFGNDISKLTMLYVGDESRFPDVYVSDGDWNVERVCRTGTPADEILAEAKETAADLLIMTTEGRHGFLDVLRGSTTEQVLHGSMCPVLAVPANSFDA